MQPRPTGFFVPPKMGFLTQAVYNLFGQHLQPQLTATPILPRTTAVNPFRQTILGGTNEAHPQATGFNPFPFRPPLTNPSPFGPSPTNQGISPFPVFGQTSEQQQQIPFNPARSFNPTNSRTRSRHSHYHSKCNNNNRNPTFPTEPGEQLARSSSPSVCPAKDRFS